MTTLAVLQPGYLPWLGFFDLVRRSDVFVVYDDVAFDKHGWRNRNRIKAANGPVWLTVPVRHSGLAGQPILEVEIDNRQPWARKHLATMAQLYARAPFLADYLGPLADLLAQPWTRLVDLDLALIELICGWLALETPRVRSSGLAIGGGRNERLLDLCRHFGATTYLSGNAARDYLDVPAFAAAGIRVEWQDYAHPTYRQQHGGFVSHLSVIDLLFNEGPGSAAILRGSA